MLVFTRSTVEEDCDKPQCCITVSARISSQICIPKFVDFLKVSFCSSVVVLTLYFSEAHRSWLCQLLRLCKIKGFKSLASPVFRDTALSALVAC